MPTKVAWRSTIMISGGRCVGMGGAMWTHESCVTSSATSEKLMLSVETSLDQVSGIIYTVNIKCSKF